VSGKPDLATLKAMRRQARTDRRAFLTDLVATRRRLQPGNLVAEAEDYAVHLAKQGAGLAVDFAKTYPVATAAGAGVAIGSGALGAWWLHESRVEAVPGEIEERSPGRLRRLANRALGREADDPAPQLPAARSAEGWLAKTGERIRIRYDEAQPLLAERVERAGADTLQTLHRLGLLMATRVKGLSGLAEAIRGDIASYWDEHVDERDELIRDGEELMGRMTSQFFANPVRLIGAALVAGAAAGFFWPDSESVAFDTEKT